MPRPNRPGGKRGQFAPWPTTIKAPLSAGAGALMRPFDIVRPRQNYYSVTKGNEIMLHEACLPKLTDDDLEKLRANGEIRRYPTGSVIVNEGDKVDELRATNQRVLPTEP